MTWISKETTEYALIVGENWKLITLRDVIDASIAGQSFVLKKATESLLNELEVMRMYVLSMIEMKHIRLFKA